MKILFICGSLEYGKDGVGDYTRRLASQLIKMGHFCHIVALMDKHISEKLTENQLEDNSIINSLRLPFNDGNKGNTILVKNYIQKFNPDLISLQFVPFSFDSKGLPFWIVDSMSTLTQHRIFHIMFHELWVGMEDGTSIKYYFWGLLQKRIILNLKKYTNPSTIHTQTNLYKYHLEKIGCNVNILPLFSNIKEANHEKSTSNNTLLNSIICKKQLTCIIFGEIHFGAPVETFANEILIFSKNHKLFVTLLLLGKNGNEAKVWSTAFSTNNFNVRTLGWQSEESISQFLLSADFGITTTPYILAEKSGTVAAMHSFGLPVIGVARQWQVKVGKAIQNPLYVSEYRKGDFLDWLNRTNVRNPDSREFRSIQNIAKQFIKDVT